MAGSALCLRCPLGVGFVVSLFAGPVLALLAFPAPLWAFAAGQFAGSAALALFDTRWMSAVQREVPND